MVNYAKDLEMSASKIEQKTMADFVMTDWSLNSTIRTWSNSKLGLSIKLEKGESSTLHFLKEKVVSHYVKS
jgi:hypothetical protein